MKTVSFDLNQTAPSIPPQGRPSPEQGLVSMRGPGRPLNTWYANPLTAAPGRGMGIWSFNPNLWGLTQDEANAYQLTQAQADAQIQQANPGVLTQAGNAIVSGEQALGQAAAAAGQTAQTVGTAVNFLVLGIAGLIIFTVYKESQTEHGRERLFGHAGEAARGAGQAASRAADYAGGAAKGAAATAFKAAPLFMT